MMKNLGKFLAISIAFVAGAMICAASIFQEPDATRAPLLPDRSVVPCANFATVEASYAAIPHRRTEFPSQAPGFSQMEAAYLRLMFKLVDQAIVVRVDAGAELVAGQSAAEHLVAYDELIRCAASIPGASVTAKVPRENRCGTCRATRGDSNAAPPGSARHSSREPRYDARSAYIVGAAEAGVHDVNDHVSGREPTGPGGVL